MSSHFDRNKPFTTRDGRQARILGELAKNSTHNLVVAVKDSNGIEHVMFYSSAGSWLLNGARSDNDLVNSKPVAYLNVYKNFARDGHYAVGPYRTRNEADDIAGHQRVGCIRVVLEERFDE